jgi:glycyl-tRNA synthetase
MPIDMKNLESLCRRRGFIFGSSEIYGGINGFWDYGPLGVELKKNIKDVWWHDMVRNPPPGPDGQEIAMVGVDCAIIMNPKVWEASGHAKGFADPMVDCKKCRRRFRGDKVYFLRTPAGNNPDLSNYTGGFEAENKVDAEKTIAEFTSKLAKKRPAPGFLEPYERGEFAIVSALEVFELLRAQQEPGVITQPDSLGAGLCPIPGCGGELTAPRSFNLMFQTYIGAIQSEENIAYLRPETAQGIFVNFRNVYDSTRLDLPFGIAQIGKAFRNEINPRNYTFRSREFEQMEIEFFCRPEESMKWYEYWRDVRKNWYTRLGIQSERLRPREQGKDELAHYSIGTTDIEYLFPFSKEPQELEGVAHRGDFDLNAHKLWYFDEAAWQKADKSAYGGDKKKETEAKQNPPYRFVPHVIEPSAGADRFALAVLCEAYTEDKLPDEKGQMQERLLMRFHPRLAPVKAAILPLVNKDNMPEIAEKLYRELKDDWNVQYDDGGAIGRRYRRQDEVGTPLCVTIDGETLQNQSVTIRERDSAQQRRVPIGDVVQEIKKAMKS